DLSSCTGRCGEGYSREHDCHCDFSCQHYMECCPDFNKVCTVALSCKGRCFESFERGRECDCDADCERYGKCCPDYATHCKEETTTVNKEITKPKKDKTTVLKDILTSWKDTITGTTVITAKPDDSPKADKDLCSGKPADGMVALQNGTLAVFRGHYYWLLNGRSPPTTNPRRISDGWGIPSPIDSVFSRCNCDGKTFFIKGPLYWRFTNGVMDKGYPKPLANGFAGLSGKIVATLPVARYNSRPESVYFIKKDGNMQQYVYRQEPAKKCQRRTHVTIKYPAFVPRLVIRRRFQRAARMPTVIQSVRINPYPSGNLCLLRVLRKEIKMTTYWRGLPKVIHSTISLPNHNKPDGYDYYAFSYNRYYSLDVGKRIARPVTALTGKTVSKDWYNCP
ncbi:PRG4 protein, partial [Chroicocephalus maculipennis]|nr:PRG4 protein [Chroicocephalus maculipennis]